MREQENADKRKKQILKDKEGKETDREKTKGKPAQGDGWALVGTPVVRSGNGKQPTGSGSSATVCL
jgi:hypothetical protein